METKINIAEILESKSQGTKLYSLTYGNCFYQEYTGDFGIEYQSQNGVQFNLDEYGKYCIDGECIIFPSKEMRDWSKFAWNKGDVLVNSAGFNVFFDRWANDNYTRFFAKTKDLGPSFSYDTYDYTLISKEDASKFVKSIEYLHGGILNLDTLEIEKQPKFKDGDVVAVDEIPFDLYSKCIFILKENLNTGENKARAYVLYNVNKDSIFFGTPVTRVIERNIHLATDEEKQKLFSALAKEDKGWDAQKRAIVYSKPKIELKPFDKVLVRDSKSDDWRANLFGYISKDGYYHCVYANWVYCIPYIGNESLLGTTKDVEV